jgi:phage tail-like protein
MIRGLASGIPIEHPIASALPSIYQGEMFIEQFTAGLDAVIAPTIASLDCLDAYIEPDVCPTDFLEWLGDWVGLRLEEDWSIDRRRRVVAAASDMFAKRCTIAGLRREIELYTDGVVHVDDPGATHTSAVPGSSFSAGHRSTDRTVRVTVDVPDGESVNWAGLQELIRHAVPAHLPVEIELRELGRPDDNPTTTRV